MELRIYTKKLEEALISESNGGILPLVAKGVAERYTRYLKDLPEDTFSVVMHKDVKTLASNILPTLTDDCFYCLV